jgi:hypothetical protein
MKFYFGVFGFVSTGHLCSEPDAAAVKVSGLAFVSTLLRLVSAVVFLPVSLSGGRLDAIVTSARVQNSARCMVLPGRRLIVRCRGAHND